MNKSIFLGNGAGLHDQISDEKDNYTATVSSLRAGALPVIAIVRQNSFHLDKIYSHVSDLIDKPDTINPFSPSPASTLADRFSQFIDQLNEKCEQQGIELDVQDKYLLELFKRVQLLAGSTPETELLRLLGILCNSVLVGPHWFVFETINACNSDCRYCNIHSPSRSPGKEFLTDRLPYSIFQSITNDLADMGVDGVTILANGEPLLHPDFTKMAVYAKAKGLMVDFFTNGLLLDVDIARAIVDSGVDEALVTISAATEKTYLALHSKQKPGDFQRLQNQLAYLSSMKKEASTFLPRVTGVHVICKPNVHEVMDMARQASALGFSKLRLALIRLDEHNQDLALDREDIARLRRQLPELESFCNENGIELWEGFRFQLEHAERPEDWSGDAFVENGCIIGWGLGLIKANGDLSFCCVVKPIANLKEGRSFRDIWNDPFYHQVRVAAKDLKSSNGITFTDGASLYTDACRHCDNHDINAMLHRRLKETGLAIYLAK